ncbi:hypothetical protein MC885_000299 [Smutsia gigantea]|nr:hypothetical protein MC885_000299 [Smutsia gigantea]
MASAGVALRGGGLGLLVWLLLLSCRPSEARAGGPAPPSPSWCPSGGGREGPGLSLRESPPLEVPGSAGAPESPGAAVSPPFVAFTRPGSDSYKALGTLQTPAPLRTTRTAPLPSGDVSGPGPANGRLLTRLARGGRDPALREQRHPRHGCSAEQGRPGVDPPALEV